MAIKFDIVYKKLEFLFDAGTSRGVLMHKKTWIIKLYEENNPTIIGYGECAPLVGLSLDDIPDFEINLRRELGKITHSPSSIEAIFAMANTISSHFPSIRFGVETALLDLHFGGIKKYFNNTFYRAAAPISINGLVWMGKADIMMERLTEKIALGFRCVKLKIGAIDFKEELKLLETARSKFSTVELELRVDANGGFSFEQAPNILKRLAELGIHSIEQPIKAGEHDNMADLCANTPIPIALDEELIGIHTYNDKEALLDKIKPQYIILKPTLVGGFKSCFDWIEIANKRKIGWWITSALESNIGLNAICQFASYLEVTIPQGLGTGGLYANNFESPLTVQGDTIFYDSFKKWAPIKA